jgi:beta-N-acetylhexosaminidase
VPAPGYLPERRRSFAAHQPFALILFQRNCREPAEVSDLTAAFRDAVGRPMRQ